ncbi:prephenate dehydratase [Myceligenerans salitolerans]|uniref:Prephenate dehydratase n=1 Tax=Myceligenerans salitolerans TaxID=1230528 RepID=A0ABS3I706_9MICO|nr:prephenate dehydratase domain-containing protein [Myceligenerans salitolerans]MBO0608416.1 prephenate dehydratase [Myceligenerans salitolerans]
MSGALRAAYLGPEGTFTHQAVREWLALRAKGDDGGLVSAASGTAAAGGRSDAAQPRTTVADVHDAVSARTADVGVVAIESSVEGYVVPSLDALIGSPDVVAVDEVVLDVSFDAFVRPDHAELREVSAHPHGLAQCSRFVADSGLRPTPSSSNAAACRDAGPHTVALGPPLCGELYGLDTHARAVEDFRGGRTRFLVLAPRDAARGHLDSALARGTSAWRTMLAVTPHLVGPGVLARITETFARAGVNMSSLITRPLKARQGQYVFVITLDEAAWESGARTVLSDLLAAGDALKTLGVFPAPDLDVDGTLDPDHVPVGSVTVDAGTDEISRGLLW